MLALQEQKAVETGSAALEVGCALITIQQK
jgi:hypothetical protein